MEEEEKKTGIVANSIIQGPQYLIIVCTVLFAFN